MDPARKIAGCACICQSKIYLELSVVFCAGEGNPYLARELVKPKMLASVSQMMDTDSFTVMIGTAAALGRDVGDVSLGTSRRPSEGGGPHKQVRGPLSCR